MMKMVMMDDGDGSGVMTIMRATTILMEGLMVLMEPNEVVLNLLCHTRYISWRLTRDSQQRRYLDQLVDFPSSDDYSRVM